MDSLTLQQPASPLQGLLSNPALRQLLTLVGMAASVALGVMVILWSRTPDYNSLYANVSDQEAAEMVEVLQTAGIPYKLMANGGISVPAKSVHEARMQLAGEGLPASTELGLDMLKDDPGFGVSQFIENKRYIHGLETELGRTIAQLKPVRDARVHLAVAKDSVFVRNRGKTTASVLLDVRSGQRLESEQVAAIVYLLARSINGLEAEQITVVDQSGRMLNSPDSSTDHAMSANQFDHKRRVEESYVQRIEDLLSPIVGLGKVRAEVVADLDFTVSEQTEETFDPQKTVVRSEETSFNERRGDELAAQGVPGATSNKPPVSGNAGATADPEAQLKPIDTSREALRNYEVDRTVRHTRQATGEIRRLSVAVIIDNRESADAAGDVVSTPRTPEEIEQINSLVRETVGFDATRGDTIQVVNSSFETIAIGEAPEAIKFWETPAFRDVLKQGLGAMLVLIVIFGLLRPMSRGLLQAAGAPQLVNAGGAALPGSRMLAVEDSDAQSALAAPTNIPVEQRIENTRKLAADNPETVAQVVKTWVAEDG